MLYLERGKGTRTCIGVVHSVERDGVVPAFFQGLEKKGVGLSGEQEANLAEGQGEVSLYSTVERV